MTIKEGIQLIIGIIITSVVLMIVQSIFINRKIREMETAVNNVNNDTTQTKLAVGYLIQEKQEATVVDQTPRENIGFKINQNS